MIKYFLPALAVLSSLLTLSDASARVFVGGGVVIGAPYYYYPPYYAYPYYAYAPPQAYPSGYPAYPGYGSPMPSPSPTDRYYESNQGDYCREYRHTVVIEGQRQEAFGHACRQPDGSWRMVD